MDKAEVANVLEEIGTILELQGENRFRTQAYLKAARAIAQLDVSLADLVAQDNAGALRVLPGVRRLQVCGSIRRCRETCKDIDLLAVADDPSALMAAFVALPMARQIVGQGETKSSIVASTFTASGRRLT